MYSNLILIISGIIAITSIWVAFDSMARKIPVNRKPYSFNNGSVAWLLSSLLLWPLTFPYYFVKRSKILNQRKLEKFVDVDKNIENLKKYKQLLDEGIIDEKDYMKKKQEFI